MNGSTLLIFLGSSLALTIAPGPDNIFVLTQGITRGPKPAIAAALGMASGVSIHTIAAALGVSALFYSSALFFNVVKFAGAAYLLYLAFLTIRHPSSVKLANAVEIPPLALYKRGFIMNVLNPKVALFFLAFLPQFVSPQAGYVPLQMLVFGLIFAFQAALIFCLIGWFAGTIGKVILTKPRLARSLDWLTAGVFTALGIRLALAQR